MCLLDLLFNERHSFDIQIGVAHVNHGIRGPEADRDESFVRDYCLKYNIPFHLHHADVPSEAQKNGESVELCARRIRYTFFSSLPYDKIATAHTGSDAIETLLMHLSRGSAVHGLTSIPPTRDKIIRPLITLTRTETEQHCLQNGIAFVTDSTNLSDDFLRNRFRHSVMEPLRTINPAFEKNALCCISALRREDVFMEDLARDYLSLYSDIHRRSLSLNKLSSMHPALRFRIIAAFISMHTCASFEERHLRLLNDNLLSEHFALVLPSAEKICIRSGEMFFEKNEDDPVLFAAVKADKNGGRYVFADRLVFLKTAPFDPSSKINGNAVDYDKIDEIIFIRSRNAGDKITLFNRGFTKTLKKLFSEEKIPLSDRTAIPVLADSRGVIWTEGFGADASRLPAPQTKKNSDYRNGEWKQC